MENAVILFSDSSRGVYIPKHFAETIDRSKLRDDGTIVDLDDLLDWLADVSPYEGEGYWDEWDSVLSTVTVHHDGHVWHLHHEGDLWLLCHELMSDEEKSNFFGND